MTDMMNFKKGITLLGLVALFLTTSAFSNKRVFIKVPNENNTEKEPMFIDLNTNSFEISNETGKDISDIVVIKNDGIKFDQFEVKNNESGIVHFEGEIEDYNQEFNINLIYADGTKKEIAELPLKLLKSIQFITDDDLTYAKYTLLTDGEGTNKDTQIVMKEEEERVARELAEKKAAEEAAQLAAQQAAAQQAAQQATYQTYQQPVAQPIQSADDGCLDGALFDD